MTPTAVQVSTEVHDLLVRVYDAFNRRDIEPILAVMDREVEWPNGMEGGWVHGRDAVRSYWTRQWSMIDPHVDPVRFEAETDGRIAIHVHQVIRDLAGAVQMDRMVKHVYLIQGGLIRRMDIQE